MKIMVIVKASEASESGVMPTTEELNEMGKFNEELIGAGLMLDGDGLRPSGHGKRVVFEGGNAEVIDGPFAETKELVAGYWVWEVKSMDEAVEWARRIPFTNDAVELRPFATMEDFGDDFTPELQEKEEELRARTQTN
ncbi:MAG: YciI family protein [Solirubrobacterales bacterium]